ncbi:7-carboxy-7-deazaguanine synthase QueE [Sinirhodobacter sp. WL0062]|uniref:7-carboxy-7-deazaguanine synthase n=1 Tax=Rhodobacter flavimaris TaxID=2907145 RepID=A0ABS8Z1C5_9RHOB|nr:7-carboxy-7-deazaguanine synthase QueE [Sinirhodobacter sp. WL0062]MCE5975225.1 7-carboxy-7-deazaguanine synthase QueE [Sinirhodobacter sp. WL0062]
MKLRISEIFGPTIQGEGALIGKPTVFVRAGGCDYRCAWCDSMHAVDSAFRHDWAEMSAEDIMAEVRRLSSGRPLTVSISGGNPAIQDFGLLIELGKQEGYDFACETQGSVAQPWFAELETLVLSPKPPSSGEETDWRKFDRCLENAKGCNLVVMKIVIFDETDYAWAKAAEERYPNLPLYLQPGNPEVDPDQPVDLQAAIDRLLWLIEKVTGDGWFAPHVLPQLHMLVWGNKRGV